jgi:hypothetical protein
MAPKINAREKTRNRSQAKKRERNRLLRTSLTAPAKSTSKSKPAAK